MRMMVFVLVIAAIVASAVFFTAQTVRAAAGEGAGTDIAVKLDEILANQKTILAELAAVKEEVRIVKIRVTQQQ